MTVYRAQPRIGQAYDRYAYVVAETGTIVEIDGESYVKTGTGGYVYVTPYDDAWKTTPSLAWEAAAKHIEGVARGLLEQANACRVRATEEVIA